MAYKHEYEVARLYTDGAFKAALQRQFESFIDCSFTSRRRCWHAWTAAPAGQEQCSSQLGTHDYEEIVGLTEAPLQVRGFVPVKADAMHAVLKKIRASMPERSGG